MAAAVLGVSEDEVGKEIGAGRNKAIMEKLNTFAADVHGYLLSGARIARPVAAAAPAAKPAGK